MRKGALIQKAGAPVRTRTARPEGCVLTINAGSSSLKFALFRVPAARAGKLAEEGELCARGEIARIGLAGTTWQATVNPASGRASAKRRASAPDHTAAADLVLEWLEKEAGAPRILAIGHRIVHGGPRNVQPRRVTDALLRELRGLQSYDPEHLPAEIGIMQACRRRFSRVIQIACFDTAFHAAMPRVAQLFALPYRLQARGVRRYGFHGLSCAFLLEELARLGGVKAARGRVVLAHLGNGASLTAAVGGRSVDTTMGFTPVAGVPMSTRSGDLDPGLVWYLARTEKMAARAFHEMVNFRSGLLGVSGVSSDMRDLEAKERSHPRAADAVALFCYQVRKAIGALAAAMGGLDRLVFSGGIGEHSPLVRGRVCAGLEHLGVVLARARNAAGAPVISTPFSRVEVRVIPTDEERMIARAVRRLVSERL